MEKTLVCENSNAVTTASQQQQTSTPFVYPDDTRNPNDLDGSIFDHSDAKEKSSLEISCIRSSSSSLNDDASREKSAFESVTLSGDYSSCATLDKGFVQSSLDSNNSGFSDKSDSNIEDNIGARKKDVEEIACVETNGVAPNERNNEISCIQVQETVYEELNIIQTTKPDGCDDEGMNSEPRNDDDDGVSNDDKIVPCENVDADRLAEPKGNVSSSSIYLEDGKKITNTQDGNAKKRKRLTLAEKRAMETLKLFGGSLDTVLVKGESFGDKLKKQKEMLNTAKNSEEEPKPKRSRLERAKAESNYLFKDIPLGKQLEADKKGPKSIQQSSAVSNGEGRRMTRLERAKMETLQSFGGTSFADVFAASKKKSKESCAEEMVESESQDSSINKENATDSVVISE